MLYSVEIEHGSELRLRIPFWGCSKLSVIAIPPYTTFSSHITFDRCTALAAILPTNDQTSVQEKALNRFDNHRLHDFCHHACHDEDKVDIVRLDETIQECRLNHQQAVVSSKKLVKGINLLHILASSACPRHNLFHALLDRLPFQLLFREDKIGLSPLMLLADNPTELGQDLFQSFIPKLVSFRSSHCAPPIEKDGGTVRKKPKLI